MIRAVVTEGKYDIVHVHTPVAAFVTRLALRKAPRPKTVYTAHGFHFYMGGNPLKNAVFIALERLAGDWTDHTVTINKEDYEAASAYKISESKRLSLMPGIGVDFEYYSPRAADVAAINEFRSSLGIKEIDELFFMAAEFIPRKRHKDAIRALAGTGRTNFHLALAGSGPLEDSMKQLASKLGVGSRVHFLGERTDIPLLMLSSRATVLPSSQEGLSRSVMESVCLGVPVLGADARGIRDIVNTPKRGSLFPVGNHAALGAAMILLVDDHSPAVNPAPDPRWEIGNLLNEHEALYRKLIKSENS
jgi:glycosyltransferase involved in cell wall biosynthesis